MSLLRQLRGVGLNGDVLALSGAERERLDVSRRLMRGELRQARAAELLGIGVRQVKRLVRGFRREGEASVVLAPARTTVEQPAR